VGRHRARTALGQGGGSRGRVVELAEPACPRRASDPDPESLQADEAHASPVGLCQLHDRRLAPAGPPAGVPLALSSPGWTHWADAVEILRWCLAWLEPWEQADHVMVHRRPASAAETACVPCERPRVGRGLAWIVADSEGVQLSV
jgi:hypothetical protein